MSENLTNTNETYETDCPNCQNLAVGRNFVERIGQSSNPASSTTCDHCGYHDCNSFRDCEWCLDIDKHAYIRFLPTALVKKNMARVEK